MCIFALLLTLKTNIMNYPAGAKNDPNAPYNQPEREIDQSMIDMAVKDLELLISRIKESNGNFPDKFHWHLEELLTINFE